MSNRTILKLGIFSAALLAFAILASGPLAMLIVGLTAPQPAWVDAQTFVANYSSIQTIPYFLGLLLVIGAVLLITTVYRLADEQDRPVMLPAIVFVAIYASLVTLNYILQTTFVPSLVRHFSAEGGILISALSMSNPNSLAWALEMWAYAFLGLATMFVAPYFKGDGVARALWWLLMLNGIVSILGALIITSDIAWVFSTMGMISFFLWNAIMLVMTVLIILFFRRKLGPSGL